MRGAKVLCALAALFVAAPAGATEVGALRRGPERAAITESKLQIAESTSALPPHWSGDIEGYETGRTAWTVGQGKAEPPTWVRERLARQGRFVQPLMLSPLLSTFNARLENTLGWNPRNDSGELDQLLHLSAGWFEIYAPVYTVRSSDSFAPGLFRAGLRLPALIGEHHVVALQLSTSIPTEGVLKDKGGFTTSVGYAFGSRFFSALLRVGAGKDQLLGDLDAPMRTSIFYDGVLGYLPMKYLQAMVQVDGQRFVGGPGNVLRVWPGLRVFPLGEPTLSLGIGAQVWLDDLSSNDFSTRRAGGFLDIGWVFL